MWVFDILKSKPSFTHVYLEPCQPYVMLIVSGVKKRFEDTKLIPEV